MTLPQARRRTAFMLYGGLTVLWIIYMVLLVAGPNGNNGSAYHLSLTSANIIRVSFALPILLIWLISAQAALRFKAYADLVATSPEGKAFRFLATGLFWLLSYLVLLLILARVPPLLNHTSLLTFSVLVKNHLPVYVLGISFIYLFMGSVRLLKLTGTSLPNRRLLLAWTGYLIFTVAFIVFFFSHPEGTLALTNGIPAFAAPHSALLFSLVLPSLLTWALGLVASLNLSYYRSAVKGIIYRAALANLVNGVYASIFFAILMELLILNASWLGHLGLSSILAILYGLIVAYAVGAILIYRGARRLSLIEVTA